MHTVNPHLRVDAALDHHLADEVGDPVDAHRRRLVRLGGEQAQPADVVEVLAETERVVGSELLGVAAVIVGGRAKRRHLVLGARLRSRCGWVGVEVAASRRQKHQDRGNRSHVSLPRAGVPDPRVCVLFAGSVPAEAALISTGGVRRASQPKRAV